MPIGRSREEMELTKLLAATLVQKEVMEPMEKIGWGHGTPPPPDYSGRPTTEGAPAASASPAPVAPANGQPAAPASVTPASPAAKADAPSFSFNIEDFKNPITGMYFDKYPSAAEAMKGLGHLANMAKTSFSERDAATARASELEAENKRLRLTPVGSPPTASTATSPDVSRTDVEKAQQALDAVLSQVARDGGVLDEEYARKLGQVQRELSRAEARYALAESRENERRAQDTENARWSRVNEYMEVKYPDASKFAAEIGLHVQSDPLLSKAVAALVSRGEEVEASELAWVSYERAVKMSGDSTARAEATLTEQELAAREQVRNEAVARARVDAGVITGSPGGAGIHQNLDVGPGREEIESLAAEMRRQGDAPGSPAAAAWRHAVIGRFLPADLFPNQ